MQLAKRLEVLDCGGKTTATATTSTSALPSKPESMEEDDDDEVDLFGSDDEEVGQFVPYWSTVMLVLYTFVIYVKSSL